ncbi:MAG: FadR/GntR family transcriptional regulator [Massiliimalia sp.]|jgi:GntR family transcriptional repressor for pyruvate dehydrogenase complex
MPKKTKMLSETVADEILSMITVEKIFKEGDKLPNENQLSEQLHVSRTTLREAIRVLVTNGTLEIRRGKGTFVRKSQETSVLDELTFLKVDIKDLFEMRLIFEPENAYYAAKRASEQELNRIFEYGKRVEEKLIRKEDRTQEEQAFHMAIAKATHNEFMNKLFPIILQAINKGVILLQKNDKLSEMNLNDHRMIMEFLKQRNAEGARSAMKIHLIHAVEEMGIEME